MNSSCFRLYWLPFTLMVAVTGAPTIASAQIINAPLPGQSAPPTREVQPYSDYILGPGDEVSITVFGYEEYALTRVIEPNGTIVLPVIGSVEIGGKTSEIAAQDLADQLNHYLVNPVVTVTTTALRPVFVTVSGEVQRPGPIQLEGPNTRNNDDLPGLPTLSTALVEAGGVTSHADIRDVRLKRTLPNGEEDVIAINLWDNLWSEAAAENPLLQDGDTIYVPRLVAGNEIDPRLVARSSLAPETVRVRVVGEVTRPGEVAVPPNSSLSSAVAIAGGPTDDARLGRTLFVRLSAEGTIERQEVNLENLTDTYQVQDGDVVIVPKRNTSSILDFAARLLNPLGSLFDIFDNDIFDNDNNN